MRLELARAGSGSEKYGDVARTFEQWLKTGVLVRDDRPSLYAYRQDFMDEDGNRRRVAGVVGALELEEFGTDSGVLPHEKTMPGPKEDRLALMRALPVNVSPIYAIYRGKGEVGQFFDALENRQADARFADDNGILHRLWVVSAPAEIELLTSGVAAGPLVIADGHHRYETALQFHREHADEPGTHDSIMCFCVDADSEELVVLPYNRAVRGDAAPSDIARTLQGRFDARPIDDPVTEAKSLSESGGHPFIAVLPDSAMRVGISNDQVVARTGERHEAWLALDVVALHEALLPELFPSGVGELRFSKDPREIVRLVREEGWSAGFLLRPLEAAQVVDVASSGERMPQKASYFWPKAVTGLVFRSFE